MRMRVSDSNFLAHLDRWLDVLLPKVAKFLHVRGGPILMVQACPVAVPVIHLQERRHLNGCRCRWKMSMASVALHLRTKGKPLLTAPCGSQLG